MKSVKRRGIVAASLCALATVQIAAVLPERQPVRQDIGVVGKGGTVPADTYGLCEPDSNCSYASLPQRTARS